MSETKALNRLLKKASLSFDEMRSVVLTARNNAYSLADAIVEYGTTLLRKHKTSLHDECEDNTDSLSVCLTD